MWSVACDGPGPMHVQRLVGGLPVVARVGVSAEFS